MLLTTRCDISVRQHYKLKLVIIPYPLLISKHRPDMTWNVLKGTLNSIQNKNPHYAILYRFIETEVRRQVPADRQWGLGCFKRARNVFTDCPYLEVQGIYLFVRNCAHILSILSNTRYLFVRNGAHRLSILGNTRYLFVRNGAHILSILGNTR